MQKRPLLFSSYFQRNHWRKKFSKQKKSWKDHYNFLLVFHVLCCTFGSGTILPHFPYVSLWVLSLLKDFLCPNHFWPKFLDCYYFIKWTFPLKEMVLYVLLHTFFSTAVYKYITFAKMKISFTLMNISEQYQKETLLNLNSYLSILYFSQFHILNTLSWQLASAQFAQPCFWWEKLLAAVYISTSSSTALKVDEPFLKSKLIYMLQSFSIVNFFT